VADLLDYVLVAVGQPLAPNPVARVLFGNGDHEYEVWARVKRAGDCWRFERWA
jgi:hypothetical protein